MKGEISWHPVEKGNECLKVAYSQTDFPNMAKNKHLKIILKDKHLTPQSKAVLITLFAKEGHLEAMCLLGKFLYHLKDYEEAVKWFHISNLNGVLDQDARFILAAMHMNGEHFPRDYQKAKKLYRENALLGHEASQFMMDNSSFGERARLPWRLMRKILWRILSGEPFVLSLIIVLCVMNMSFLDLFDRYVLGIVIIWHVRLYVASRDRIKKK